MSGVRSDGLESDFLCFSNERWSAYSGNSKLLLEQFARHRRVYFIELPVFDESSEPRLEMNRCESGVTVVAPHLPSGTGNELAVEIQKLLLDEMIHCLNITGYTVWCKMSEIPEYARHLEPELHFGSTGASTASSFTELESDSLRQLSI